jgi:hypothetical protein
LKDVVAIHWDDDKKILLTASLDKSIKMYQFPIYWPAEMMRKKPNKKKADYDEEKELMDEGNTNNQSEEIEADGDIKSEEDVKRQKIELSEREMFSEDLDGWDVD